MRIETLVLGPLETNTYLVGAETDPAVLVIDPAGEPERIRAGLRGRPVAAVLLTHGHFDHTGALGMFQGIPVYIHPDDQGMLSDPVRSLAMMVGDTAARPTAAEPVGEGDTLRIAGLDVSVLHTPGHTPGSVTYRIGDVLFTGDTMFFHSYGRTDFPGGSPEQMKKSLRRLKSLPGDLRVCPGHGPETSLSEERKTFY